MVKTLKRKFSVGETKHKAFKFLHSLMGLPSEVQKDGDS